MPLSKEREADLIKQAKAGQESAFRELVKELNPRLFRIARGVLSSSEEAEDAVQESYIKAFSQLEQFKGDARFVTWISRITLNTSLMMLRKYQHNERFDALAEIQQESAHEAMVASPQKNPDRALESAQLGLILEDAISKLTPKLRLPFMLYELEGMSTREIAEQLDITTVTVKTRIFRARRQLRHDLVDRLGEFGKLVFYFAEQRCVRLTEAVVEQLKSNQIIRSIP